MKNKCKQIAVITAGMCAVLLTPIADADYKANTLSSQWWQWADSIPTPENPMLDLTGAKCAVGQHGSTWFLAGVGGTGVANRTCSIPEGTTLFFPIVNAVGFNSPNVCGQDAANAPISDLRKGAADFIDTVTKVSVKLDGKSIHYHAAQRIRSGIYALTLPEDNAYDKPCADAKLGNVPAGVYSPAVDDGYYVTLKPLKVGTHKLQFSAKSAKETLQDVTYNLTVIPVLKY
jgi:hypothetical protein